MLGVGTNEDGGCPAGTPTPYNYVDLKPKPQIPNQIPRALGPYNYLRSKCLDDKVTFFVWKPF